MRRNSFASSGKVMVLWVGMKMHCFDRQSMMTKMDVKLEDRGNCSMKSMEMEIHGHLGIRSCLSTLVSRCLSLGTGGAGRHVVFNKVWMPSQVYSQWIKSNVQFHPKCPEMGWSCLYLRIQSQRSLESGT